MGLKPRANTLAADYDRLLSFALKQPGAWEDHPWGETVVKVGKKVFVFFNRRDSAVLSMGFKLPNSAEGVLSLPFAEPTHYGLGKYGWVTLTCTSKDRLPREAIEELIVESYLAIAPKKIAKSSRS